MPTIVPSRVSRIVEQANKPAHGFTLGKPIAFVAGQYALAQANDYNTLAWGIVSNVIDANNFEFVRYGKLRWPSHGLMIGAYFFVSDQVPGVLTTVPPVIAGSYQQMLMSPVDPDTVVVFDYPSLEL